MIDENKNPWNILRGTEKYDNPWINVTEYEVTNPSGNEGIYGKVHFKSLAIGIIPLTENNEIILVGQYRFPLNAYSWEIPEGGGRLDLDPIESAKRELLEETGLVADHWQKLLDIHTSNSVSDELGHVYLATGLTQYEAQPEETEELQIKKIPFNEAFEMVMNNKITDSLSIAGILKLHILLNK